MQVRYAQEQLHVVQMDRDQLAEVVRYTKEQTKSMGEVVSHIHQHVREVSREARRLGVERA